MVTFNKNLSESLWHSKSARIRFYGSNIFKEYQHLYGDSSQGLHSDIFRYGAFEILKPYLDNFDFIYF